MKSDTELSSHFLDVSTDNTMLQDATDEAFAGDMIADYECTEYVNCVTFH